MSIPALDKAFNAPLKVLIASGSALAMAACASQPASVPNWEAARSEGTYTVKDENGKKKEVPYVTGQGLQGIGIYGRDVNPLGIYAPGEDGLLYHTEYRAPAGRSRTLADGDIFTLAKDHPERFVITNKVVAVSTEGSKCRGVDASGRFTSGKDFLRNAFAGSREDTNIDNRLRCNWVRAQEDAYNAQNGVVSMSAQNVPVNNSGHCIQNNLVTRIRYGGGRATEAGIQLCPKN